MKVPDAIARNPLACILWSVENTTVTVSSIATGFTAIWFRPEHLSARKKIVHTRSSYQLFLRHKRVAGNILAFVKQHLIATKFGAKSGKRHFDDVAGRRLESPTAFVLVDIIFWKIRRCEDEGVSRRQHLIRSTWSWKAYGFIINVKTSGWFWMFKKGFSISDFTPFVATFLSIRASALLALANESCSVKSYNILHGILEDNIS